MASIAAQRPTPRRWLTWAWAMALSVGMLSGCATPVTGHGASASDPVAAPVAPVPVPATTDGQWDGRLSLKLGALGQASATGLTMAFELTVKQQEGQLNLSTPMGTRVAMVHWRQGHGNTGARLETSEGPQSFDSLDELTRQVLGEALPLEAMLHWLHGRPAPDSPAVAQAGQPLSFAQSGWQVDATALHEGRLDASRPGTNSQRSVTLRLRLDL